MSDLHKLSIIDAIEGLRSRQFSAEELTLACLAQIERLDGTYKAFITVAEDAVEQARAADGRLRAGDRCKLLGIPIPLKDLFDTAGLRTTYGSAQFADHVPEHDDIVVARLRAAGAIILGKTNTPEFGYGAITTNQLQGPTANPFDPNRTSAGSSGGSAVAVAMGMAPAAIGSDFGGSVRMPASFCAIVGMRPAIGTIPTVPKLHLWQNLIATGVFGRSIADVALVLDAIAGPDPRDPLSLCSGAHQESATNLPSGRVRVAASATLGFAEVDHAVAAAFEKAVDRLRRDYDVTEARLPWSPRYQESYEVLRGALLHDQFAPLLAKHGDLLSPTLRWNASRGEGLTASKVMWAERQRSELYLKLLELFASCDIIATLAAPIAPFFNSDKDVLFINGRPMRNMIDYSAICLPSTLTGFPSLCLPCGWTETGLPIGMQLIAPPTRQALLLAFAARLEQELGFRHVWPAVA